MPGVRTSGFSSITSWTAALVSAFPYCLCLFRRHRRPLCRRVRLPKLLEMPAGLGTLAQCGWYPLANMARD